MKIIEWFLNGIIWCLHDIGRSIKCNPLTRAWRKIETPEWAVLRAPPSCKSIICDTSTSKERARHESKFPEVKKITGFKEHVRREALLKPIPIYIGGAMATSNRMLQGQICAIETQAANNRWYALLGGGLSGLYR